MSNYRRLIAALLGVLLLQLSLPVGARACGMHHDAAPAMQAPGHGMGDMAGASDMGGCGIPSAGQCETMTACALTALPSVALRVQASAPVSSTEVPEPATIGSRLSTPPELPPPRA